MTIREKIAARESELASQSKTDKAIRTMIIRIALGYIGGTVIGLILRWVIYGQRGTY